MDCLKFNVNSQSLERLDTFKPATDSVEYLTVTFTFSDDWSGTAKTAKFRKDDLVYPANINSSGVCVVPWEVLVRDTVNRTLGKQYFYMTLEGVNGTRKITTAEVAIEVFPNGKGETTTPNTPTPDVYSQYVEDVKAQTGADVTSAQQSAETAIAYAEQAEESARSLKNDYSNALKGNASGAVVRVDDVSPVEHNSRVKVVCPENVDPSTVTVTRCGKNLVNISSEAFTQYKYYKLSSPLPKGTYMLSAIVESADVDYETSLMTLKLANGEVLSFNFKRDKKITYRLDVLESITSVHLYSSMSYDDSAGDIVKWKDFQIERGVAVTDYEQYNGTEYTPNADGTVNGLASVSPTMTLLTDTEGVTVECEYNRDINVVIADILAKLS